MSKRAPGSRFGISADVLLPWLSTAVLCKTTTTSSSSVRRRRNRACRLHPSFIHSGIEDLKEKREEVNRQILKEEEEKAKIQNDLRILTERLSKINDSLARKAASRNEYDKTIMETEAAYMKVGAWLCLVRVPPVGLRRRRNTSDEGRDGAARVSLL